MFSSRFVPFVRVLTPMLMGVSRLHLPRVMIASFASAFLWALVLSLVGKAVMAAPVFAQYHELLTAPAGDLPRSVRHRHGRHRHPAAQAPDQPHSLTYRGTGPAVCCYHSSWRRLPQLAGAPSLCKQVPYVIP